MEQTLGKITILVNDKPEFAKQIQYGFVKVKGMKDDVFFNILTSFQNTAFEDLKIGDRVCMAVKQTAQGPYAESLTPFGFRLKQKFHQQQPVCGHVTL